MEQFEASKEDMLSQLELTIDTLLEFPDEDHQLLRDTVDQIREAYETVTEKVSCPKKMVLPRSQAVRIRIRVRLG